jgi:hypothetical protein
VLSSSLPKPTKAEEAYYLLVKTHGCMCCLQLGFEHDPDGPMVEANHALSGGVRIGHHAIYGLCQWHHRGRLLDLTLPGWTLAMHREHLGPALSEGSVPFELRWGTDEQLLEQQAKVLECVATR